MTGTHHCPWGRRPSTTYYPIERSTKLLMPIAEGVDSRLITPRSSICLTELGRLSFRKTSSMNASGWIAAPRGCFKFVKRQDASPTAISNTHHVGHAGPLRHATNISLIGGLKLITTRQTHQSRHPCAIVSHTTNIITHIS